MRFFRSLSAILLVVFASPLLAQALTFSDLSKNSPNYAAIMALAEKGVIGGNPDGTFKEKNPLTRAAALKMLYVAAGRSGDSMKTDCFVNEKFDAWFAPYVCDAVLKGYVSGYGNGKFGAADPVTFAQALKMTLKIFDIPVPETSGAAALDGYINVKGGQWYTFYVAAAVKAGILPLPGQDPAQFFPDDPITRGQAASMIYNGWKAPNKFSTSSSSAAWTSAGSSSSQSSVSTSRTQSSSQAGYVKSADEIKKVSFPFENSWTFSGKNSTSYTFQLKGVTVVDIVATLAETSKGAITCRLYRLQSDGFSLEYYLGYEEGKSCSLLTALTAGDYQLQLSPTTAGVSYKVTAKVGKGDGNDGLSQARPLQTGINKVDYLDPNDLEDWFVFTVKTGKELGSSMTLQTTGTTVTNCLIYPWSDVDVYGFSGPKCNEKYSYMDGTYYVRIGHGVNKALRQTYSVELK